MARDKEVKMSKLTKTIGWFKLEKAKLKKKIYKYKLN